MLVKSVFLLINVLISCKLCEGQAKNKCEYQETCSRCIQEPGCIWCSEPSDQATKKCRLEIDLESKWCPPEKLMKPKVTFEITQDNAFNDGKKGDAVQFKPQRVKLRLRKGEEYNLDFQYSKAADYPVDLYYLMDLSQSMKIHKNTLANLGKKLVNVMMNITTNFQLGFGSFVDKTGYPFTSIHPTKLDHPCDGCTKTYSYKNHLSLTSNYTLFSHEVTSAKLSSNIDYPEGGFDAMLQAIVCKKEIGWRDAARHLLIFSTDADPHIAGDGRLVGAFKPNDGKCRLKNNMHDKSVEYDYPSVSFLNHVAKENNINLIFAIVSKSKRVYRLYQNLILSRQFENSEIGKLNDNSTNIVDLVVENYNKIVDSVRITANASKSVEIKYQSSCQQNDTCTSIRVGDIVNFTAIIKATECKSETIQFKPEGVAESLVVELHVECRCDCEKPGHQDYFVSSTNCSGHGNKVCGTCQCNPGYFGSACECNQEAETSSDPKTCKQNDVICSNRGICKCGTCICDKSSYGKYCECTNHSCKRVKGLLCSGEDHGECDCGQCKCLKGWKGDDCSCVDNDNLCIAPSGDRQICSGHGECICGQCKCNKNELYFGKYCEECPTCEGQRCQELRHCVECQVFKTGKYKQLECDSNCTEFTTILVDKIEKNGDNAEFKICSVFDDVNCTIFFKYQYENGELMVEAQEERRCYEPLDYLVIGASILGSVIVIGLITLIIWKIVTSIHDKIEYEKFEKERQESKWHHGDNPLYVGASRTFQNPTYRK